MVLYQGPRAGKGGERQSPQHITKIDGDVKTCWTRCNKLIRNGESPIKLYGVLAEL